MSAVDALWLQVGSAVLLVILLYRWLWKASGLVPEMSTKAVLITGCDSGFGHELAKRLDKLGLTVFAGCLLPEGDGAKDLKTASSSRLHILHLDVTREDHVQNAVKTVTNSLGNKTLWAVVNNAGIAKAGPLEWMDTAATKKVLDVNTVGPLSVTNAFLPLLKISRGRLVFVSSLAGRVTFPFTGVYTMSKHATITMANILRFELKLWGITVHDIQPGAFRTNITNFENMWKDMESTWLKLPEEIRAVYGQKYIEKYQELLRFATSRYMFYSNIYKVIDDLQDAVVGKCPKNVYHPGLTSKLYLSLVYLPPIRHLLIWLMLRSLRLEVVHSDNTKLTRPEVPQSEDKKELD